jgi:hypothetical protein
MISDTTIEYVVISKEACGGWELLALSTSKAAVTRDGGRPLSPSCHVTADGTEISRRRYGLADLRLCQHIAGKNRNIENLGLG